jgi:hypothetical protein
MGDRFRRRGRMLLDRFRSPGWWTRRNAYRTGWQVAHEFAVTQHRVLHELVDFCGVGMVIVNRRHDNYKEPLHRYVVRSRVDLRETIIPFFRAHPLRTAKRANFEKSAYCVDLIDRGVHRDPEGLMRIAEVAQTTNRRKPRNDLIRILRDHTPEVQDTGS